MKITVTTVANSNRINCKESIQEIEREGCDVNSLITVFKVAFFL